jgi:formylglycine-generating enzyme required for sulfatase activity
VREAPVEPVAEAPAWSPVLPSVDAAGVARALREARRAEEEGRLLGASEPDPRPRTDAGDAVVGEEDAGADSTPAPGALEWLLAVLAIDADHAEALAAIDRIATELLRRGDLALVQGQVPVAQRLSRVVERAVPRHPGLAGFRARVDAGRRAQALVERGEERARAGRVLYPEGQGAVAAFRDALRAVPGFVPAGDGLAKLQATRLNRALAAAQAGDYEAAEKLQAEAGRIVPDSPALQDMAARIVELRRTRTAALVAQGQAAVDAMDLELAGRCLREAERVSVQAQGLDALAQRIELARRYGRFRPGQVFREPLAAGGEAPEMVVLPHGRFTMGAPDDEADRQASEGPARPVEFARGFAIARNETTVGDYARFVRATGYRGVATRNGRSTVYDERAGAMSERAGVDWRRDYAGQPATPDLPVVHVAFEDAEAYAAWLAAQTGERYRLPSEAEFEYALRGGRDAAFPWGEGPPPRVVGNLTGDGDLSRSRRRWSNAIPGYADGAWGPAPVRSHPPEAYGTFDLVGNVSEWVQDCWHDSYLRAPADGSAWVNPGCGERVVRGASWASTIDRARSAWRQSSPADTTHARLGFRVVREL